MGLNWSFCWYLPLFPALVAGLLYRQEYIEGPFVHSLPLVMSILIARLKGDEVHVSCRYPWGAPGS